MREVPRCELPRILVPALAERLGVSRAVVRSEIGRGNWVPLARGVVLTRPERPSRLDWGDVGLTLAGATAALSGWDAAQVMGVGPRRPPTRRVLVLTREGRSRRIGDVLVRRTHRPYLTTLTTATHPTAPLTPLAPPARAVADTALDCVSLPAVRSLVAAAVQRRLCTLADVAAELDDGPRNRSALLRAAVEQLGDGARSEAEVAAVTRLARAPVPPFEVNVPVVDEDGVLLYVVDVLWRELRAGLEVDSRECHFSDADWQRTLDRHNQLTRLGLSMTHYAPSRIVRRGDQWLVEVADWLTRRAAEVGVVPPPVRGVAGRGSRRCPDGVPEPYFVRRTP